MTAYGLGPTQLYSPAERLLHGNDLCVPTEAMTAEEWVDLDSEVHVSTSLMSRPGIFKGRLRIGFRWFDMREIADWSRAPYWQDGPGGGAPSWSSPPTSSEIALCLSHVDPRVRAAALDLAASGALPDSLLPLVLIHTADTHPRVRALARAVAHQGLGGADFAASRQPAAHATPAALAVLVGRWRHGAWLRETVLDRPDGLPGQALTQLLSGSEQETRLAGLNAGAAHGRLDLARAWTTAANDPVESVRVHAVRTAIRLALASGRPADADDARTRVLARLDADRAYGPRLDVLASAVEAELLSARDLAGLAVAHGYRKIRRQACDAVLAHPEADTVLGQLLSARDTYVRSAAVARLGDGDRADRRGELRRYLTDPSGGVRAAACRGLRALGEDPRTHYRALCSDPAAVGPAAVIGLAEQGHAEDAALLHPLTQHPDAAVRARALSALRLLRALPDEALQPFADDPDPRVRATALTGMRDSAPLLRGQLHNRHEGVRARVRDLLEWHRWNRADSCRCCATPAAVRPAARPAVPRGTGPAVWGPQPAEPVPTMTTRPDVTPFGTFPSPDPRTRR
ncbi:HEAT repeat domain-containing protein [Streptomyces sp. CO7]